RPAHQWVLLLIVCIIAGGATLVLTSEFLGVGFFDQNVELNSAKPIERVSYCCYTLDEQTRRKAEDTADPRLFEWDSTVTLPGARFVAQIKFTTHSGCFHHRVYYCAHLIVLAEFTDGTRACRVLDLPNGCGKVPVTARFR